MCQPSRVTWITGCLPSTTQVYLNEFGSNRRLRPTLLRALSDAGYRGGYLGLFHCWPEPDRDGLDDWSMIDWIFDDQACHDGWNVRDEHLARWRRRLDEMGMVDFDEQLRDFHHHAGHTDFPLARHTAVRLADRAVACIEDIGGDRPHALWTSFWMPHEPWAPSREFLDLHRAEDMPLPASWRADRATRPAHHRVDRRWVDELGPEAERWLRRIWAAYAGCLSLVDQQIGRILDALRCRGLYDDSLIVFCTDHGTTAGAHGWLYKGMSYALDDISRVPCLVKLPGQREARVVRDIVSSADLYPTVCELIGAAHGPVDGKSWSDVFSGRGRVDARAFTEHGVGDDGAAGANRSLRRGRWKYTLYSAPGVDELYDLEADPHELRNVADDHPRERAALRDELLEHVRRGSDRLVVAAAGRG